MVRPSVATKGTQRMSLREKLTQELLILRKAIEYNAHHLKTVQSITHLTYFGLVVTHGPYDKPAAVLFFIGLLLLVVGKEIE